MLLSDFDYVLPKELIAQHPPEKRGSSRLLVLERKPEKISHCRFSDILRYLVPGDLLVLNNTRVVPVRLIGSKKDTSGKVDVLLSSRVSERKFQALIRPALRPGQEVIFNGIGKYKTFLTTETSQGRVLSSPTSLANEVSCHGAIRAQFLGDTLIEFERPLTEKALRQVGFMPLPAYIKRQPDSKDMARYQTVYARRPGAIAAPTAGLHFTKELLERIKDNSVGIAYITLHVGLGTFKPVRCVDVTSHKMEAEEFDIPWMTLKKVAKVKRQGGRIFAVGTTTARTLETASNFPESRISADCSYRNYTELFIYPGYKFKAINSLLTNFHLPKTTLLILACAFGGRDLVMRAYKEAIREKYRFYSYGDAMLII